MVRPLLIAVGLTVASLAGCATLRVTDPSRTADEQFLQSEATRKAIAQLSFVPLRDRRVYVDSTYLFDGNFPNAEQSFLLGELRNRMLIEGVTLANSFDEAEIVVECRSGAIGVNRSEFLLGFPGVNAEIGRLNAGNVEAPVILPELAIVKNRRQNGFASVSITAYWRDTGDLVASSGPFVGRTERTDYWFFGIGPQTTGNIPPAESE